jgi:hypothetical protein
MGILIFTARFPSFFICTYQVSWGFHVETTDMFTARKGRNFQRFINRRDGWRAFPGKSRGARAAPCGTPPTRLQEPSWWFSKRSFLLSRWRSLLSVILVTCRHVQASVDPPGPGGARLGIQIPPCPINNPNVLF